MDRNKYYLSTSSKFEDSSIESESSASSVESESSFSIFSQTLNVNYFLNEKFSVVGSYNFALVLSVDAEVQGFDLGMQYYFLENGSSKELSFNGNYIETSPELAPFVYLGATTRDYQFSTTSLKFQGLSVKAGADYHIIENYVLTGDIYLQYLKNNNVRTMTTFGASISIGYKY